MRRRKAKKRQEIATGTIRTTLGGSNAGRIALDLQERIRPSNTIRKTKGKQGLTCQKDLQGTATDDELASLAKGGLLPTRRSGDHQKP